MRFTACAIAVTLAGLCVGSAGAQTKMAFGVEAGALSAGDDALLQLGLRAAPTRGGFGSVDFTFATFPDPLFHGVFAFLMDLGITYGAPRDSSPVFFFPHAGVSVLAASSFTGSGGGGGVVGYNAGAGLLLRTSPQLGIRIDYTYRRFREADVGVSSITAGLMFMR